jgi:hypothetical protein
MIFCSSCDKSVDPKGVEAEIPNHAEAGSDQISNVGSYAVLDASKSNVNGEEIKLVEWKNDPKNPEQLTLFAFVKLTEQAIEFEKEGIYKFILQIECKSGTVYLDSMQVTVKPRQNSVIEDTCLEVSIRELLKYKEGALTADNLQLLDSLQASDMPSYGGKIKSLKGMEYCTNLTYLHIGFQGITDLRPISELTKIEDLSLTQNWTIEDISPLSNLTNLKILDLEGNPIKDINALSSLTKLTELILSRVKVSDLTPLSRLYNLEELDLGGVNVVINSLEPLRNLTKLRSLELAGRDISDLSALENLTELKYLGLYNNKVTKIAPLAKMKKLERLVLGINQVNDLKGLSSLDNLDYLDLAVNQVKDISELQYMKKLTLIGLSNNKIEDLSPIYNNPNIGNKTDLYLNGNPLNEKSINEYIPALIKRGVYVSR